MTVRVRTLAWQGVAIGAALLLGAACTTGGGPTPPTTSPSSPGAAGTAAPGGLTANIGKDDKASLTGAGATFPAPVYQAWFDNYKRGVAKGVQINYQAIGSGGGIQQYTEKTVDFGASDAPMSDDELKKAPDTTHVPMVVGAVVLTYNIQGITTPLKLDGATVGKIFLGDIKKWNDAAIAATNPGVNLPANDIQVVHRSDGSGTSFVFTDWLSNVSPDWKSKVGTNKNPNWPAGQGGQGNAGVTQVVKQTPNSIGYVELNYAIENKLPYADIKNRAGKFVTPNLDSVTAAASKATIPDDYRVSIVNAEGDTAYPVASFTYLLVAKDRASCEKQAPLVHFMWWAFHDQSASATAKQLNYSPVPAEVVTKIESTLKSLKCEGKAILG
ncbi:MAG: phosphate ABC transporter substrate-binding protein PstS [Dehalococcoidia bacterium]